MAFTASRAATFLGVGLSTFKEFLRETSPAYAPKKESGAYCIQGIDMTRCAEDYSAWLSERKPLSLRPDPEALQELAERIKQDEKEGFDARKAEQVAKGLQARRELAEAREKIAADERRAAVVTEMATALLAGESPEQVKAHARAVSASRGPRAVPQILAGMRVMLRAYGMDWVDHPAMVLQVNLGFADLAFQVGKTWYVKYRVAHRGVSGDSQYYWELIS